ncbi:MAG TPA: hypothetical protein VM029_08285 [Opitutaceae bacterium]|nr:hypothetical protein [Opitutaceae bacterium]
MSNTARLLTLLAVFSVATGCRYFRAPTPNTSTPPRPAASTEPLAPSPRLVVGRIIAVDPAQHFAFIELAADAPRGALSDGTELNARTAELKPTARLQVSRYARGRTLGTRIVSGQPAPGDEVVWLAP